MASDFRKSRLAVPVLQGLIERTCGWRICLFEGLLCLFVVCAAGPHAATAAQSNSQVQQVAQRSALRPPADASPQLWIEFYRQRLQINPKDRDALKGLAYQESQLSERQDPIQDYRHVLEIYPDDRDSRLELARLLT